MIYKKLGTMHSEDLQKIEDKLRDILGLKKMN